MPLVSSSTILALLTPCLLSLSYLLITSPTTLLPSPTIYLLGSSMGVRPARFPFFLSSTREQTPASQTTNPPVPLASSVTAHRELLSLLALLLATLALLLATFSRPLSYTKQTLVSNLPSRSTSKAQPARTNPNYSASENSIPAASPAPAGSTGEKVYALLAAQTLWQALCAGLVFCNGALVVYVYLSSGGRRGSSDRDIRVATLLSTDVVFAASMAGMLFWGYLYTVLKEERREVLILVSERDGRAAE